MKINWKSFICAVFLGTFITAILSGFVVSWLASVFVGFAWQITWPVVESK